MAFPVSTDPLICDRVLFYWYGLLNSMQIIVANNKSSNTKGEGLYKHSMSVKHHTCRAAYYCMNKGTVHLASCSVVDVIHHRDNVNQMVLLFMSGSFNSHFLATCCSKWICVCSTESTVSSDTHHSYFMTVLDSSSSVQ